MRRLVVPLLLMLIIGCVFDTASAQVYDGALGFVKEYRGKPGSIVEIPIYLRSDSTVTGIIGFFQFNHNILHPVIAFEPEYQALLDSELVDPGYTAPDSINWSNPEFDDSTITGRFKIYFTVSDSLRAYGWQNPPTADPNVFPQYHEWAWKYFFYDLKSRDSLKVLMLANPYVSVADLTHPAFVSPHIPGGIRSSGIRASDTAGVYLGTMRFRVDSNAAHGAVSQLHTSIRVNDPTSPTLSTETQFSEDWVFDTTIVRLDTITTEPLLVDTNSVDTIWTQSATAFPQLILSNFFIVDTSSVPDTGHTDANQPPVLGSISPTVYNIRQSELVSFTVSATDAELGVLTLRVNGGNLTTPNASFGIGGVATGADGVVSSVFSFKPDLGQEGNFVFTFQAQDDSGASSASQTVTVVVEGFKEDVLFTTSSEEFKPSGGIPGLNEVIVPVNLVSEKVIYGIQFDLEYNANYFDLDSIFTSDRTENWEIFDDIGETPGELRALCFGLSNDSMVAGSTSAALYLAFTVDPFAVQGCYPLNFLNGRESIDPDPNVPGLTLVTDSGLLCVDLWGDVNLDREVNVADLVSDVGYILSNYPLTRRQFAAADVTVNDTVNVIDLVGTINIIFGRPISPNPTPVPITDFATLQLYHDEIMDVGVQSEVAIEADMPVDIAGVELDISYNPGTISMLKPILTDANSSFKIYSTDNGSGKMKVLIHSQHPWNASELLPEGLADIVKLPFVSRAPFSADDDRQVRVTRAVMTTGDAQGVAVKGVTPDPVLPDHFELYQNRPNPFNPTTTIEFYIDGSAGAENVKLEVFNIIGQTVKTLINGSLQPGQHSVVWDGTNESGQMTASGVYLYRLKVGDADKTKKMVLLK